MDIKEILVMHHSHFDVGYTHSQPIVWQLQYEFIEQALDLLDATEAWDDYSKPRWTCEVTAQITKWLEQASAEQVEKFSRYVQQNRIGISGMEYNTTPNCTAEQLTLQLQQISTYNQRFNTTIKTVHQHDVNGIPWAASDIMLDAGIELFIMGINNHFGGAAATRPALLKWQTPSDRSLMVMNGAHYTMFDQLLDTHTNSLDKMQEGYKRYLEHLNNINYNLDFIYLTTANAPVCYDNAPPNLEVAEHIRSWNEQGRGPIIRYITPNMLLERVKKVHVNKFKNVTGDWSDYWNFGAASTAYETKLNQNSKVLLNAAEMISTNDNKPNRWRKNEVLNKARAKQNLYDEHTWGSYNANQMDNSYARSSDYIKKELAYTGKEMAEYYMVNELEHLAGNAQMSYKQDGVLIVNTSPQKLEGHIPIPNAWFEEGKQLRTARFGWKNRYDDLENAPLYGPVEIEPYSWKKIPLNKLKPAKDSGRLSHGDNVVSKSIKTLNRPEEDKQESGIRFIESPYHKLSYNPITGRIISLYDKRLQWEVLDGSSQYTFFQYVREFADPLHGKSRRDIYARDLDKEKYDINCWVTNWHARYETAYECSAVQVEQDANSITLLLTFMVQGARYVKQRISLQAYSPIILLEAEIDKLDRRDPEGIYFTFPLNMDANWQGYYHSAGTECALDSGQMEGSCKGWQTVENYAAITQGTVGAALFTPDAPMVQFGDFNFGRKHSQIDRKAFPKLLAWPLNNYWDTNFPSSQPGVIKINYGFNTFQSYAAEKLIKQAQAVAQKMEIHPLMHCAKTQTGSFIKINDAAVQLLNLKRSNNGVDKVIRLVKQAKNRDETIITLPYYIEKAWRVDTLENRLEEVKCEKNKLYVNLVAKRVTQFVVQAKTD